VTINLTDRSNNSTGRKSNSRYHSILKKPPVPKQTTDEGDSRSRLDDKKKKPRHTLGDAFKVIENLNKEYKKKHPGIPQFELP